MDDTRARVANAIRRASVRPLPDRLGDSDSFVSDYGFDSLRFAILALELEDQLGCTVLLDEWIRSFDDPRQLTYGSLCAFVEGLRRDVA